MKSKEFDGYICDGCGKPFTVEQAYHTAIHVGFVEVHNLNAISDADYHNPTCFRKSFGRLTRGELYD